MTSPDLSLVLACYNEEPILRRSVTEIFGVLDALPWKAEVIFVDDASRDGTAAIIEAILRENPARQLSKLRHAHNIGRGGTVADGIRSAQGRFVGFIDVDLEVHPRHIGPCVTALDQGCDVATVLRVYKFRFGSLHRDLMSHGYRALLKRQLSLPLQDTETGYKFFRRERILPVLDQVQDRGWFWDTEIMARAHLAGLRISEIPAPFDRCMDKPSSVRIVRDSLLHIRKLRQFSRVVAAMKAKDVP